MKKLMILGAGIYQVPLIKKAKEMGLYTIVASIPGKYPGFAYADKIYYVDTTDKEQICRISREEKISGICTTGTDVAVPSIGYVCDSLDLPGVSENGALCASDKNLMKERFIQHGVNTARYHVVSSADDIKRAMDELEVPLIFKAVDSSGSRGIVKVSGKSREEIDQAVNIVKKVTKKNYFIIEEFIDGEEFGAQALIYKGKVQFVMPHGDYVFVGDTGVPIGHFVPYNMSDDILEQAYLQTVMSAEAIGLDNCALNVDFILRDGKVYVLEIGARAGATCLPEMISIYYGIDFYKMIIQTALGEKIETISSEAVKVPNACRLVMAEKTGTITRIQMPDVSDPHLKDISLDYKTGDQVRKFHIGPDRIGQVITSGDTLEHAVELLDNVCGKIEIDIE